MNSKIDYIKFGERLKKLRLDHSFKLKEVKEKTGIDISTLSRIERGSPVKDELLEELCKLYDTTLQQELGIISGVLGFVTNDGTISLTLRQQIIKRRKELGLTLTAISKKSSIKKSGRPTLSISVLSAIERGKQTGARIETLQELLNILGMQHETVLIKKMQIGVSAYIQDVIWNVVEEVSKVHEVFHFEKKSDSELLLELRNRTIQFSIMPYSVIQNRIEYIPVAVINETICFVGFREAKRAIKDSHEYILFFHELLAVIKALPQENGLKLLFHPEWVL